MKKNIWFFGCSFTKGRKYKEGYPYFDLYPEGEVWTSIVARYFNLNERNRGRGGSSNPHIINTLISNLSNIKDTDIVIIGNTVPTRDWFYNERTGEFKSYTGMGMIGKKNKLNFSNDVYINKTKKEVLKAYILEFLSNAVEPRELLFQEQIDNILNELQKRGVTTLHWSHDTWGDYEQISEICNVADNHWSWKGHSDWASKCIELLEAGDTTYKTKNIPKKLI
jgi:hypothetical protein